MNLDPNNTPTKQKKVWQKPELYLLDTDDVNGKTHPNVHENTGFQYGSLFYNKYNGTFFKGTIKQAIS